MADWHARAMTDEEVAAGPPWHAPEDLGNASVDVLVVDGGTPAYFIECSCPFCMGVAAGIEAAEHG